MNQLSGHEPCTQESDTGDIRQRCMSRLAEHEPWMHESDNGHISCGYMLIELLNMSHRCMSQTLGTLAMDT